MPRSAFHVDECSLSENAGGISLIGFFESCEGFSNFVKWNKSGGGIECDPEVFLNDDGSPPFSVGLELAFFTGGIGSENFGQGFRDKFKNSSFDQGALSLGELGMIFVQKL